MKRIIFLFAIVLSLSLGVAAQSRDITKTLMDLQRQEDQAEINKDSARLERLLSNAYFMNGPDGKAITRAEYIKALLEAPVSPQKFKGVSYDDFKADQYGITAVANYVATFTYLDAAGKDDPHRYRITTVWVKEQGKWRMRTSCSQAI